VVITRLNANRSMGVVMDAALPMHGIPTSFNPATYTASLVGVGELGDMALGALEQHWTGDIDLSSVTVFENLRMEAVKAVVGMVGAGIEKLMDPDAVLMRPPPVMSVQGRADVNLIGLVYHNILVRYDLPIQFGNDDIFVLVMMIFRCAGNAEQGQAAYGFVLGANWTRHVSKLHRFHRHAVTAPISAQRQRYRRQ
jgi:hypothetical protein